MVVSRRTLSVTSFALPDLIRHSWQVTAIDALQGSWVLNVPSASTAVVVSHLELEAAVPAVAESVVFALPLPCRFLLSRTSPLKYRLLLISHASPPQCRLLLIDL
jgi:hypothetical protein